MGMKNLDAKNQKYLDFAAAMAAAAVGDDKEAFQQAVADFGLYIQERVMQDARELADVHDATILAARGVRQLTAEETKYYQALAEAMKSPNPQMALTELDVVLPETVIDKVFEDLKANHPLLDSINFTDTSILTKWIMSESTGEAGWDDLNTGITKELGGSFKKVELTLKKLSAYFPVHQDMLALGPVWLDRFVRTVLVEALAVQLEAAIVDGDGKNKPIGMTRKLSGATDDVYPRKTPIKITRLDPVTIGGVLDTISQGSKGKDRAVPELLMIVHPRDYYPRVFPATTVRCTDGSYNKDTLPYPAKIVVSAAVPKGHAVFGLASKYFMGMGSGKDGKIEHSDEFKFLDDVRVYKTKLYGNGRAEDENAFVYADISELKPINYLVEVVETDAPEV